MTALGVLLAVGASLLYNLGLVVQAEAARAEPTATRVEARLLVGLLRRARWLAGTGLVIAGWPLQALALGFAPLTVVQPALAAGLVLPLALGAVRLGEHVRGRDYAAVGAIGVGVALVVLAAPPRSVEVSTWTRTGLALGLVAALSAVAMALGGSRVRGPALIAAAGLAYAGGSLTTKLLADAFTARSWALVPVWGAAAAAAGAAGTLAETHALQVRAAGEVASVVFALQTVVPLALSPLLFGEHWSGGAGTLALRAAGLALAIAGAIDLTRSEPVLKAL